MKTLGQHKGKHESIILSEAVHLARIANMVRRDMLQTKNQFDGSFEPNSQKKFVPVSLLLLVAMDLNGPNIKTQTSSSANPQQVLTLSQKLVLQHGAMP